jgi:hypothetical protein
VAGKWIDELSLKFTVDEHRHFFFGAAKQYLSLSNISNLL